MEFVGLTCEITLKELNVIYHQIDFDRNPLNIVGNLKAYIQMNDVMKIKYDLVHSHSPIGGVIARLTAKKYRKNGLLSIYTAHGFHFYKGSSLKSWILFYPIEKNLSKFTDILITINQSDFELAKKRMYAKQIEYIPGVGIERNNLLNNVNLENVKYIKSKLNLFNKKVLLSVGELNDNKNHKMVLDALMNTKNNNYIYLLIGLGPKEEYLKTYIINNNLQEKVKILGYKENICDYYYLSDIFVFPSKREGLSVALMEAMTFGLPIICSSIRGNTDLVDENGGYLFDIDRIDDLQFAIEYSLENPDLMVEKGKYNALKSKNFDKDIIMEMMEEIYQ